MVLVDLAITCHAQTNTKLSRKISEDCENVKYLGSLFYANGGAEKDVNNRVKIAWSNWRETTGVMCDKNMTTKLKDNVQYGYKTSHGVWCGMLGS